MSNSAQGGKPENAISAKEQVLEKLENRLIFLLSRKSNKNTAAIERLRYQIYSLQEEIAQESRASVYETRSQVLSRAQQNCK